MKKLTIMAIPLLSLLAMSNAQSENSDTAVLHAPAAEKVYQAREALIFALPEEYRAKALTLEINNIDVSAGLQLESGQLKYHPLAPLPAGKNTVRLVHFAEDGSVHELGYWEIEVGRSARFQELSLQGGLDMSLNQRLAEEGMQQAQDDRSFQASGHYSTVVASQNWRTEGSASVMYVDDPLQSLTGKRADIPGFYIKNTARLFTLNLGDHVIASPNLLQDGFQKRGVSTRVRLAGLKSTVDVLSVATDQRAGLEDGLGISDENSRTDGARLRYQPIKSRLAHLVLSTSYLSGKSQQDGFASWQSPGYYGSTPTPDEIVNKGEAWNAMIDGFFFDQALRWRYEYASSRYDFDGIHSGEGAASDAAWSSLVLFNLPAQNNQQTGLNLGFEKKKIGTEFKSIANLHLPADKDYQKLFLNGSRHKWNWATSFATENNNLDTNPDFAQTETRQLTVSASFQEYEQAKAGSLRAILGMPSVNLSATNVEIEDLYTPPGFLANDISTRSMGINSTFMHNTWNWSLALNRDELTDHTGWQPQTKTESLMLNASIQLGKKYYLGVGWQLQQLNYLTEQVDTYRQYYSLEARANFIPDRLFASLNYGINQNKAEEDPYYALRDQSTFLSGDLTWLVKKPKNNRLGVSLSLAFQYNEFVDYLSTINNNDGNQVFLKIKTVLPTALPGVAQ